MNIYGVRTGTSVLLTLVLFSVISAAAAEFQFEVESMSVKVFRDGLVHVSQTITVDSLLPEVAVPLLSASVENLIILDEDHLAVDYRQNANNLTVFTLGASRILVEYDTISVTNKEADVWTIILSSLYNLTVVLPKNSTIVYLNQVPTAIDTSSDELSLSLYPGQWEISYIVPLLSEDQNRNGFLRSIPTEYLIAAITAIIATILILITFVWSRRRINVKKILNRNPGLMKEDIAVIEFLAEKEGKAFEAEIRQKFPDMPRTSLWRLVRRLEKLDVVEVKKIGLENQVQLKK